jgi:hypothetical protein
MQAPVTFSHDTLHLVINQLALIVSYTDLVIAGATNDRDQSDLTMIRQCAYEAAKLLERPLADTE